MSGEEKFDVIVVGGGPAGIAAGYFLAKKGFKVVVLEKGEDIGTKNMFGGRIYSHVFDKYFPGWREEAPIERWVRREKFTILCKDEAISIDLSRVGEIGPYDSFTTFLSKFLKWMAQYAESTGALILPGVKVDRILFKDGFAVGVEAEGDRLESDYVIVAEGVNTLLLESMGIKRKPMPSEVAVGVKEVIKLGRDVVNGRFGLSDGEGIAEFLIGYPLNEFLGGGFLYTMNEYVTIGAVVKIEHIYGAASQIMDIAEYLRMHKYVWKLLRDGTMVEYSAHMVGESPGSLYLDKPYGNGYLVVGDAAGTLVNTGFTIRGVDYAVESSRLASQVIEESHSIGDKSKAILGKYKSLLDKSVVGRSVRKFRNVSKILSHRRLHKEYVDFACDVVGDIYSTAEESPTLNEAIKRGKKGRISYIDLMIDLIRVWRSL